MAWVRLDDRFFQHPKVLQISNQAFRLYVNSLCYSSLYQTDGNLLKQVVHQLCASFHCPSIDETHPDDWIAELLDAGLWEMVGSDYAIHDFLVYNLSKDERDNLSKTRSEIGKIGGLISAKQRAKQTLKQKSSGLLPHCRSKSQAQTQTQTQRDIKTNTHSVGSQNEPTAFVALWKSYPAPKGSRQEALKAFRDVCPPENVVELLAVQVAHKSHCDSQGIFWPHMPHCVRWLKHRRWTDEIPTNGHGRPVPRDPKAAWKSRADYLAAVAAGRVHPQRRIPEWETPTSSAASAEAKSIPQADGVPPVPRTP